MVMVGQVPDLLSQVEDVAGELQELLVLLVLLLHRPPLLVGNHLPLGVGAVLADHHKGGKEDRLERDDHRQQSERIALDPEADPAPEPDDVEIDEQHRARKGGDLVGDAVLPRIGSLLLVLDQSGIDRGLQLGNRDQELPEPRMLPMVLSAAVLRGRISSLGFRVARHRDSFREGPHAPSHGAPRIVCQVAASTVVDRAGCLVEASGASPTRPNAPPTSSSPPRIPTKGPASSTVEAWALTPTPAPPWIGRKLFTAPVGPKSGRSKHFTTQ